MMSLRMRLTLPIALVAVGVVIAIDLVVLSSVRRQCERDLGLRLQRQASLLSSIRLEAGEGIQLRGIAIVALRPDGTTRLPFQPWEPSGWTSLDADGRVPHVSEFLDVPAVGMRLERPPETWKGVLLPDEQAAILISTQPTASAYSETRVRLLLATLVGVLTLLAVSLAVGSILGARIRALTQRIMVLTDDDVAAFSRARVADELTALSNELEFARSTLEKTKTNVERLQRMRSEFLANVSHEVRTPLFALKGYLETLLDGGLEDQAVNRSFLQKAQHHASRLDALLKDLVEISRIETGDMKMSFRYFRLHGLMDAAYSTHLEAAQARGQKLECRSLDVEVLGDRERLMQVLSNLLQNAIAYCPQGSRIALSAIEREQTVRISVADNGPGIAPEHHERVFERFYRIDTDRSREAGGTGLGLAIVKHIVEAHGAKITISSTLGAGSEFSFELQKGV